MDNSSLLLPKVCNFSHFLGISNTLHRKKIVVISTFIIILNKVCIRSLRSLRSGLSVLGSGGWSFEAESYFCFMYLKEKSCAIELYQCVHMGVHDLLGAAVVAGRRVAKREIQVSVSSQPKYKG